MFCRLIMLILSYLKRNDYSGVLEANYTESLLGGKTVYLEYDIQTEDTYGRTLAYVYFEDGSMLQDILLEEGFAQAMTVQPNSKYVNHFAELQYKAMEEKNGFWR